jgi:uncharacterized protein YndB with AHSA1/START domain
MNNRESYDPGPARDVRVEKEGARWTLVMTREFRHAPEKVWIALVEPEELKHWAPFEASASLGVAGQRVLLTTAEAPGVPVSETTVVRADAPRTLEYTWGGRLVRWELEPTAAGTRLTLWAAIDPGFISMGAAGWHLCLDVMDRYLAGTPMGRLVAGEALKFDGWQRLNREYNTLFQGDDS